MTGQMQLPMGPVQGAISPAAGEAAKTTGMALAAAVTRPEWATACRGAIELMARRGVEFQAADLLAEGLVDEPGHPSQWGPAFGNAARDGVIRHADYAPSKRATVHKSICKTWIGAQVVRAA